MEVAIPLGMMNLAVDVPVVVDSVKMLRAFPMTRCNYLSVECDAPKPGWQLGIGGPAVPFLMLELVGIIQQPFGAKRFDALDRIEDLFRRIEEEADLLIDINDIWLPNFLFTDKRYRPVPGNVYRIKNELFAAAFLFREGRQDEATFLDQCRESRQGIILSEEETSVFRAWREQQIRSAKEQYPKEERLELRWRE
jgi:hypothetical protein